MTDQPLIAAARQRFAPWLIEPMLRNRGTYIKVAAAAAMINLFAMVSSLFTMTVYDRVIPNDASSSLVGLSIGLAIVVIFDFVLRLLRVYFVDIAGANIDYEVGDTLFAKLLSMRLDRRPGSTGTLTGLMRELETLRDFFASATLTAIIDVPFIIITLAVMAMLGGILVLPPLAMIPVVVVAGLITNPALDHLSAASLGDGLRKQSVLVETVGSLETVKAIGAGGMLGARWRSALKSHAQSSLSQRLTASIAMTVANSANIIAYCGIIILGVGLIRDNSITTGTLLACSILCGRAIAPLAQDRQPAGAPVRHPHRLPPDQHLDGHAQRRAGGRAAATRAAAGCDRVAQCRLPLPARRRKGAGSDQPVYRAGRARRFSGPRGVGQVDPGAADPGPVRTTGGRGHD